MAAFSRPRAGLRRISGQRPKPCGADVFLGDEPGQDVSDSPRRSRPSTSEFTGVENERHPEERSAPSDGLGYFARRQDRCGNRVRARQHLCHPIRPLTSKGKLEPGRDTTPGGPDRFTGGRLLRLLNRQARADLWEQVITHRRL